MSLALDQGILKCISTDTVRAVMRSYVPEGISPALHRSSYAPAEEDDENPVKSCTYKRLNDDCRKEHGSFSIDEILSIF